MNVADIRSGTAAWVAAADQEGLEDPVALLTAGADPFPVHVSLML